MRKKITSSLSVYAFAILAANLWLFAEPAHASSSLTSTIQAIVLDSIGCTQSPQHLVVLAGQISALTHDGTVDAGDFASDKDTVRTWCRKQIVGRPSERDISYCVKKYSTQMDAFLQRAVSGESAGDRLAVFDVHDKAVAPDCKMSPREQRTLESAFASRVGVPPPASDNGTEYDGPTSASTLPELSSHTPAPHKVAEANPVIPTQTKDTEDESQVLEAKRNSQNILQRMGGSISHAFKGSQCPEADNVAKALTNGSFFDKFPCASSHPYNANVLNEVIGVHKDLALMKKSHPGSLKGDGGGYKMTGYGTNVPFTLGSKYSYGGDSTQASYCSGALFTVFARTIGSVDHGAIYDAMSREQLENFIPSKIAHPKGAGSLDDYGVYGIINNNGRGIQDLNNLMGSYKFGDNIASGAKAGHRFDGACGGDMMQWDRQSRVSGHSGVFLAKIKGKVYFWSSNRSTEGYGVTCENESDMLPHIVRLKNPKNLAAIPDNKPVKNLKGADFHIETAERLQRVLRPAAPIDEAARVPSSIHAFDSL